MSLSDLDLQLYLSGTWPPGKRLRLRLWAALSPALRRRLAALEAQNAEYASREMPGLRMRLGIPGPAARPRSPSAAGANPFRLSYALGGAALAGLALFLIFPAHGPTPRGGTDTEALSPQGGDAFTAAEANAKGTALGVTLYARGDSTWKIPGDRPALLSEDTLQAMPLPGQPQHLLMLGWTATGGFVRIFPKSGAASAPVSAQAPPPSLVLTGLEDNFLICVTSNSPLRVQEVLRQLEGPPFRPLARAPHSHLSGGGYFQVYVLKRKST